jgi:murein DD-endopeptidase MepM/ murein hydrolase activator NlpD
MKNKLKNFSLCYICLISFSINAERFGDPGEIIALKASGDDIDKYLTVKINESLYKLIPLPFEKQNESIYVDDVKININQKDFGESRITIENNSMVNLSKEDSDRAFKESKIIQKALNNYSKFLVPDLNFMNPVEGIISSRYGKKRYINNQPRSPHLSLDIAAAEGTKIVSPAKGRVILVGDFFYAGNYIVIDHGYGLLTSYSHLSKIFVEEYQIVTKGEKIGEVGSTGRVTGPHLHWTVYLSKVRINPELLIQEGYLESLL